MKNTGAERSFRPRPFYLSKRILHGPAGARQKQSEYTLYPEYPTMLSAMYDIVK
jgi:hypothetical protein